MKKVEREKECLLNVYISGVGRKNITDGVRIWKRLFCTKKIFEEDKTPREGKTPDTASRQGLNGAKLKFRFIAER